MASDRRQVNVFGETLYRILTDEDIARILPMGTVINVIEQTLRAKAEGALIATPRFSVDVDASGCSREVC